MKETREELEFRWLAAKNPDCNGKTLGSKVVAEALERNTKKFSLSPPPPLLLSLFLSFSL